MDAISNSETASVKPVSLTAAQEKAAAVQAYYEAPTREAKGLVVKKYPILETVFCAANHS